MKKIYTSLAFFLLYVTGSNAQVNYSFAATSGTYTPVTGTAVSFAAQNTAAQATATDEGTATVALGYPIIVNGISYTSMNIATNGFVYFGAALNTNVGMFTNNLNTGPSSQVGIRPIVAALWDDLDVVSSANVVTTTIGTAPNRTFIVQYSNVSWDYNLTSGTIDFQIRFEETTNLIRYVYGASAGAVGTGSNGASVGIAGATSGSFLSASALTASATVSNTAETNSIVTMPANGLTFTFTPATQAANDAGVSTIFTQGVLAQNNPHVVSARISNIGSAAATNLQVTLTVSGNTTFTNTQTITSLASGATALVNFAAFTPTATGAVTVNVAVPSDDNNGNNSASVNITTNATQQAYYIGSSITNRLEIANSLLDIGSRFTIANPIQISTVAAAFIQNTVGAGVTTNYSIWDATGVGGAPGTRLWVSADSVVPQNGTRFMSIPVNPPVTVTGSFYIIASQAASQAYGLAGQTEQPVRSGVHYLRTTAGWVDFAASGSNFRPFLTYLSAAVLPVTFANFTGTKRGTVNDLVWVTANETNNAGFEIERSADGRTFSKIAFVASRAVNGTSNQSLSYTATDAFVLAGTNHYRLKQIDKDGKTSFSAVVTIAGNKPGKLSIGTVYPNPAVDVLNLQIATPNSVTAQIIVLSTGGKVVGTFNKGLAVGDNMVTIPVQNLSKGTYFVKVIDNNGDYTNTVQFVK